jgi:lysozyme family protein
MAEFDPAFKFMLPHEGGYNFTAGDQGGKTKFGISQATYPNVDIEKLTLDEAKHIYDRDYWIPFYLSEIVSQALANKIFDMSVNMRPRSWASIVQEACCDCGVNVVVDGVWGPLTRTAVNSCNAEDLIAALKLRQEQHYRRLVAHDPTQEKFLKGWLNRANA